MSRILAIIYLGLISCFWVIYLLPKSPENDKIRFLSLAWQKQSIEANQNIVAEWNALHPDMQVEYVQGTWGAAHDYLITGFETGDLPDVIHFAAKYIVDYALKGYLTDLSPYISPAMKSDIVDVAWSMVTRSTGEVAGIPFLMEPQIVIYNKAHFESANISPPDVENPWTWDEFRAAAKVLTRDTNGDGQIDHWGVGMGLKGIGGLLVNIAPSFGGSFVRKLSLIHI